MTNSSSAIKQKNSLFLSLRLAPVLFVLLLLTNSSATFAHAPSGPLACNSILSSADPIEFKALLHSYYPESVKTYRETYANLRNLGDSVLTTELMALIPRYATFGEGLRIIDIERNLSLLASILKNPKLVIKADPKWKYGVNFLSSTLLEGTFSSWAPFISKRILSDVMSEILKREDNAQLDIERYGNPYIENIEALLEVLGPKHRLFTDPILVDQILDSRASLRLVTSLQSLPPIWRKKITDSYLTNERIPVIKIPGLALIKGMHDNTEACGSCPNMTPMHLMALGAAAKGNSKYGRLVVSNGVVIGFLKFLGDHSFLSLTNAVDKDGKQILAAGMVYELGTETYSAISKLKESVFVIPAGAKFFVKPMISVVDVNGHKGEAFKQLAEKFRRLGNASLESLRGNQ